jgi:hypothetical protein
MELQHKPCPICQHDGQAAIWPYLKGGTGRDGERIDWLRCSFCHALFSDLTQPRGVYAAMCRDPALCMPKGYCPRDPTCNE